ncbi:unnamed protein product [Mycena citricolor]|uniref:Uncharacterized protein n=1 Tax=Mycena citricolor TaxID=2018698 RepID=A0AAD2Q7I7_9AGAR|nr:unnamed protein product [Mycena citricolor]
MNSALHGKVKETVPGLPHYAKGRFLQTRTSWPVNVIDAGMGGQGTLIDSADGGKSLIGQRWGDTNTHASAVHWASRCAPMVQILSMAWSRGHPDPIQKMLQQHRQTTPCAEQFAAEITKFLPQWREVQERAAFLEACKELTQPGAFRALAAHFGTREERDAAIFACGNPAVTRKYRESLASSPAFDPVSPAEYQERFVDFTDEELEISCKKVAEDINNYC